MSDSPTQSETDRRNAEFWNELCGSHAAKVLGMTGSDRASLAKFDRWFFQFYPYVDRFIPFPALKDKDVLEVGLGYGSVSQRIAEHGARLTALDIAQGPVVGVNHRLAQCGLPGKAVQGSILDPPFPPESFDYVISIGCFHHTGNLPLAIAQTAKLLRFGGKATIMTYSATSYMRWLREPGRTWRYVLSVATGDPPPLPFETPEQYDVNSKGEAAPETVLLSKIHFKRLLRSHFRTVSVSRANAVSLYPLHALPRSFWLKTLGGSAGLDLYACAQK
jgi:2-polyprenyl-3-methyl-5-hydroxy-6-metoxy-1,4-benzoquinol methylase